MKKITHFFITVTFFAAFVSACGTSQKTSVNHQVNGAHPALYATLYQQFAAEYKALCYQAYTLADLRLKQSLEKSYDKPLAIILDIDETVLDNIPYQAAAIKGDFGYPVQWAEWMEKADAEPLAGVVSFLQKASDLGVEIFYVSNRKETFKEATIRNLKDKQLPFADTDHVLLRQSSTEKESRRALIKEKFEVIMLVGDNLGDFDAIFEVTDATKRMNNTIDNKHLFGDRWIVLPNAAYGSWVDALPGYNQSLSPQALSDTLKVLLKGF